MTHEIPNLPPFLCPACGGQGKVHNHDQPGDDEDTALAPIMLIVGTVVLIMVFAVILVVTL